MDTENWYKKMIKTLIQHVIIHIIHPCTKAYPSLSWPHTHTHSYHTPTHTHTHSHHMPTHTTHPHTPHAHTHHTHTHTVFSSQASLLSLHDRFYHDVNSVVPCFRLTNATHQIGCSGWSLGGRNGRERVEREGGRGERVEREGGEEGKRKRVRREEG